MSCTHDELSVVATGVWGCDNCSAPFTLSPVGETGAFETALDAIAGTMSAVLFDYTERIAERYGLRPDAVRTDDTDKHDCEAEGHDRNVAGICIKCGDNPFLGN